MSVIVVRASRPLLRALQRHRFYFRERTYRCDYPRCARWARPATRSAVRSPRTGKCWRRRRRRRCLSWSLLHWRAVARGERKGDRTHALARTHSHRQADSGSSWSSAGRERATQQEREEGPPTHVIPVDMKYRTSPAPYDIVRVFICDSALGGAIWNL